MMSGTMKRFIVGLAIIVAFSMPGPIEASVDTRRTPVVLAVEKAIPAVVDISTKKKIRVDRSPFLLFRTPFDDFFLPRGLFQDTYVGTSLGSGVVVDREGYVITNSHVVSYGEGEGAEPDEILVLLHGEDEQRKAEIVGRDPAEDIAVLRILGEPPKQYLPLGNSSDLMIGETVIAIGYALGQSHTVTQGIISQLGRYIEGDNGVVLPNLIQTDADINPGNSGGPLINLDGELIGINTAIATPSGGSVGIGFAIPVNRVRKVYNYYVLRQPPLEYRLGIQFQDLSPTLRMALRSKIPGFRSVKDLSGVLVTNVDPSGAASGQLEPLDLIQLVNGRRIRSGDDIGTELVPVNASDVQIGILREGKSRNVSIALKPGSARASRQSGPKDNNQWLGMELKPLDQKWRKQWNMDSSVEGLVVSRVANNSPADRAELEPGDIITEIAAPGLANAVFRVSDLTDIDILRRKLANAETFIIYFYRYEENRGWSKWRTEIENKPNE